MHVRSVESMECATIHAVAVCLFSCRLHDKVSVLESGLGYVLADGSPVQPCRMTAVPADVRRLGEHKYHDTGA